MKLEELQRMKIKNGCFYCCSQDMKARGLCASCYLKAMKGGLAFPDKKKDAV